MSPGPELASERWREVVACSQGQPEYAVGNYSPHCQVHYSAADESNGFSFGGRVGADQDSTKTELIEQRRALAPRKTGISVAPIHNRAVAMSSNDPFRREPTFTVVLRIGVGGLLPLVFGAKVAFSANFRGLRSDLRKMPQIHVQQIPRIAPTKNVQLLGSHVAYAQANYCFFSETLHALVRFRLL